MWTRQLLKENAKIAFRRNYWSCIAVCVISMILTGEISSSSRNTITIEQDTGITYDGILNFLTPRLMLSVIMLGLFAMAIGLAFSILISNVVEVGCSRYFIENREHKTEIGQLFYGFKGGRYGSVVWIMFFKNLSIFLWSLLLLIPGIIKSFSYMMVPYIAAENTELDRKKVMKMSEDMMRGHKMEAFILELSFIGWGILGALTWGLVNLFWTAPYKKATYAEFYSAVKAEALQNGIVRREDLPGVQIANDEATQEATEEVNEEATVEVTPEEMNSEIYLPREVEEITEVSEFVDDATEEKEEE